MVYRASRDAAIEQVMPLSKIPLKGEHNVENVVAAVCAARQAGAPAEAIGRAIEKFQAVEHRLEFVATVNGVDYYNDSKATNVDATAKAIAAFQHGIHLILGGKDKGSDYTTLVAVAARAGARRLHHRLGSGQNRVAVARHRLPALLRNARPRGDRGSFVRRPGEVVLLAPACSSFDQFESYEHRGRVFKELVGELRGWKVRQNAMKNGALKGRDW